MTQPIRPYTILAIQFDPHVVDSTVYHATSLSEALAMAERDCAGCVDLSDIVFGILPTDYAEARAELIAFNEADGLLIDGDPSTPYIYADHAYKTAAERRKADRDEHNARNRRSQS